MASYPSHVLEVRYLVSVQNRCKPVSVNVRLIDQKLIEQAIFDVRHHPDPRLEGGVESGEGDDARHQELEVGVVSKSWQLVKTVEHLAEEQKKQQRLEQCKEEEKFHAHDLAHQAAPQDPRFAQRPHHRRFLAAIIGVFSSPSSGYAA